MHTYLPNTLKQTLPAVCILCSGLGLLHAGNATDSNTQSGILGRGIVGEVRERIEERTENITNHSGILSSSESLDADHTPGPVRQIAHAVTQPVKDGISEVMPTRSAPMTHSGFLQSYDGFTENPETGAQIWRKEAGVLAHYSSFIIAPILVYPAGDAEHKGIDSEELQKLTGFFRAELAKSLTAAGYKVVEQAGPQTAVLRIAIVNLTPGNPIAYAGSWMPYARIADAANTASGGTTMGVGSISIEAEMLDSLSGERQAAVIDTLFGKKLDVRQNLNKWETIANAVHTWTNRFTQQVLKAHKNSQGA